MNEQLIKFIELCLIDGVVTDKEREVIFRKSKELGVPEDECEIILEGMIQQKGGVSEVQNISKKVISTEKKELELTFNNLNQTKVLKNDINDLELEIKEKETLINEPNKEIQKIIKELDETVKPINDIYVNCVRNNLFEDFEGGQMLEDLTNLFRIDKSFFNKKTPGVSGILLVVGIHFLEERFLIFKKENKEVLRFMIKKKYWDDSGLDSSEMNYFIENEPYKLLYKDFNLINEQILNKYILSQSTTLFYTKSDLIEKFNGWMKYFKKPGNWRGKIIKEDILDMELELLNNLSHKVYLK